MHLLVQSVANQCKEANKNMIACFSKKHCKKHDGDTIIDVDDEPSTSLDDGLETVSSTGPLESRMLSLTTTKSPSTPSTTPEEKDSSLSLLSSLPSIFLDDCCNTKDNSGRAAGLLSSPTTMPSLDDSISSLNSSMSNFGESSIASLEMYRFDLNDSKYDESNDDDSNSACNLIIPSIIDEKNKDNISFCYEEQDDNDISILGGPSNTLVSMMSFVEDQPHHHGDYHKEQELTTRRSSMIASTTKKHQRRNLVVTFNDTNLESITPTLALCDYTKDEIDATWYSTQEKIDIRSAAKREVRMIEKGMILRDNRFCSRGLEKHTNEASELVEALIDDCIHAVYYEQLRQYEYEENDDERIAMVYSEYSEFSSMIAYEMAIHDAEYVVQEQRMKKEGQQQRRKKTMKKDKKDN